MNLKQIIKQVIKESLDEAPIGHDWKMGKNQRLRNPNATTTSNTGKDRSLKGYKVGDEVTTSADNKTRTYRKTRDTIPHKQINPEMNDNVVIMRGYKQFRYDPNTPGVVYPLYIKTEFDANHRDGLKVGEWYQAGSGELWTCLDNNRSYVSSNLDFLANRPGWHLIDTPWGNQRGGKPNKGEEKDPLKGSFTYTNDDEVWVECEIWNEVDYNEAAQMEKDGYLQNIPEKGFYYYKTNSNGSNDVKWMIADRIRLIRVLSDDSVDDINGKYFADKPKTTRNEVPQFRTKDGKTYKKGDPILNKDGSQKMKLGKEKLTYYPMPRKNGNRVTDDDIKQMGFNEGRVRLTESQLHQLIKECVKQTIKEMTNDDFEAQYQKFLDDTDNYVFQTRFRKANRHKNSMVDRTTNRMGQIDTTEYDPYTEGSFKNSLQQPYYSSDDSYYSQAY